MTLHPIHCYLFAAIALTAAHTAGAAQKRSTPYTGSLAIGLSQFDYPKRLDAPLTFDIATVNVTAGWDKGYIAVDMARDVSAGDISQRAEIGEGGYEDREITLGYRLSPRLWAFAGELDSETTLDLVSRGDAQTRRIESYKQEGLFYGFAYSYPFKRNGLLKFTVSYADLDAKNRFGTPPGASTSGAIEFDDLGGDRNGKNEGYRYGVTWLMPLSETLYYQAEYRVTDRDTRVDVDDLLEQGHTADNSAEYSLRLLTMGLKFLF